jgi:CheY-like chemotaxis protein
MKAQSLVLVVEDNEANQLLVRAVLELEGIDVRIAGSGPEALDVLRECVPQLILMDVQLPGQDGLTLTRLIKADPATAAIPIVALTAHAMTGDRELALDAGCIAYISKPIDTRTFGLQVQQLLSAGVENHDRRAVAQ